MMNERKIGHPGYPFTVTPLGPEDGGGFLVEYPDLPGCRSDGETVMEAVENGEDAVRSWIGAMKEDGRKIPEPGSSKSKDAQAQASGKWLQRAPKSLHAALRTRAEEEGVSLNKLVELLLAGALGWSVRPVGHALSKFVSFGTAGDARVVVAGQGVDDPRALIEEQPQPRVTATVVGPRGRQ